VASIVVPETDTVEPVRVNGLAKLSFSGGSAEAVGANKHPKSAHIATMPRSPLATPIARFGPASWDEYTTDFRSPTTNPPCTFDFSGRPIFPLVSETIYTTLSEHPSSSNEKVSHRIPG
jgi:hypothetical protein